MKPNPFQEIVQPFVDVWHAPRALWGVNLGYMLEGLAYFGVLGYLAIYFSQEVFAGVANPDTYAHNMVAVLTGGITIAMLFLGFVPDKWGVRRALIWSFVLLVLGRVVIAGAPTILHLRAGLWSPLHLATMLGILIVVIGYGMYQPAAYAAVRQFTTPRTSGMAYAMLYALMNLGGWFPSFAFLLRDQRRGSASPARSGSTSPSRCWRWSRPCSRRLAINVLPSPGMSSRSTWPSAIRPAIRSSIDGSLPTIT